MYGVSSFRLAEAGHEVVGVEFTELPVKEFFTENNLPSEHEQVGKLVRYKVSLVCCTLLVIGSALPTIPSVPTVPSSLHPLLRAQMCQGRSSYGMEIYLNVLGTW